MTAELAQMLKDPSKMDILLQIMREDAAERERTGETPMQQIMREKLEWAEADAKSAELKTKGNDAFKNGDYKTAYVIYTACMHLSGHEPLYPLNRAAVALSKLSFHLVSPNRVLDRYINPELKLYETAVKDASAAIAKGDFNRAKAHFRRGQARCFLGEWTQAEEDYADALALQPGDRSVVEQVAELKRLRDLPAEDQTAWISAQAPVTLLDIFEAGEVEKQVKKMLDRSLN
jgi:tetratricopeptide (TPR) repeat protein